MLLSTSLAIIGISFPLVALTAPIKCPPGAPCIPEPWREDQPAVARRASDVDPEVFERGNPFPKPGPGPTFPDPPMHPDEEKRQVSPPTYNYYGYPVKKGPVKIERSAGPGSYPLDGAAQPEKREANLPPSYIYECFFPPCGPKPPVKIERSAVPETDQSEKRQSKTGTWPYYGYPVERPVKIERSADPEPNLLDDIATQPNEKRQNNEPTTWSYRPPPPTAKHPERSTGTSADQPERRQAVTGTWPYYGYVAKTSPKTGPTKIERSASPEPVVEYGPHDPETPHPHYVYSDKRSAEPEPEAAPESIPWDPHSAPHYTYPDPAPQKRSPEAGAPAKLPTGPGGTNGGGPRYLYQDSEKRAEGSDDEKLTATATTTTTSTAMPYYGYRVPEKREEAPASTATPYYGYRVPEKREEKPEAKASASASATPYYGYRVPGS